MEDEREAMDEGMGDDDSAEKRRSVWDSASILTGRQAVR